MRILWQVIGGVVLVVLVRYQLMHGWPDAAAQIKAAVVDPTGSRARQAAQHEALRLKPDQFCFGEASGRPGSVYIKTVENGADAVSKLMEAGQPVPCVGQYRLRAR